MIAEKIKNIFSGNASILAIDVNMISEQIFSFNVIKIWKEGENIDFETIGLFENTNDLSEKTDKNTPIVLILRGKGIIYKQITISSQSTEKEILNSIMMGANPDNFYLQQYTIQEKKEKKEIIAALARKTMIDSVIDLFVKEFEFIINISIGPFILDEISSIIPKKLIYGNISIETDGEKIMNFSNCEESNHSISIAGKNVESDNIPAIAAGFHSLLFPQSTYNNIPIIKKINEEYQYKKRFSFTGKISLIVIFLILLINFFFFDHYYNAVQQKYPELKRQEEMIDKLKYLNLSYSSKTKFLQETGLTDPNKIAYVLDRIAASIPTEIVLTDMQVNPLINKTKKDIFNFKKNTILISGKSNNIIAFNNWVKEMKKNIAYKDVTIASYEKESEGDNSAFTIEITTK